MFPSRNKFNAQRTEYGGRIYASKREAEYAQELDWRVKAGELMRWEAQIPFELIVNGTKIGRYTIDFAEYGADGSVLYTEVKGRPTEAFRLRFKVFEALYPELRVQIVR